MSEGVTRAKRQIVQIFIVFMHFWLIVGGVRTRESQEKRRRYRHNIHINVQNPDEFIHHRWKTLFLWRNRKTKYLNYAFPTLFWSLQDNFKLCQNTLRKFLFFKIVQENLLEGTISHDCWWLLSKLNKQDRRKFSICLSKTWVLYFGIQILFFIFLLGFISMKILSSLLSLRTKQQ